MTSDDKSVVMLSVRVPRELKERLEEVASQSGVSIQELVGQAVAAEVEVWDEMHDDRRAAFAKLATERNRRRRAKLARVIDNLHP